MPTLSFAQSHTSYRLPWLYTWCNMPEQQLNSPSVQAFEEALPNYADIEPSSPSIDASYSTLHSFYLRSGKAKPWLTLELRSRATSAKFLPLYCDRDVITGDVKLDLPSDEKIKGLTLTVCVLSTHIPPFLFQQTRLCCVPFLMRSHVVPRQSNTHWPRSRSLR